MASSKKRRTIVEDTHFSEQINALVVPYPRLDEALVGLYDSLSKNAEAFPIVPGTQLSEAKINASEHVPALRICFRYDAEKVYLVELERMDDDAQGIQETLL